jgi:hypothetical protein
MFTTAATVKVKSITLFPATRQETEIKVSCSYAGHYVFIPKTDFSDNYTRGIVERYK